MVDAAYNDSITNEIYAFSGSRYVKIKFSNAGRGDKITNGGPLNIIEHWHALAKAGFSTVDAVLTVPGVKDDRYFFFGGKYVRIRLNPDNLRDEIVYGPSKIVDAWKCLAKAGFDTVDAAMPVPGVPDEAYFFRGTNYVKVHVHDDRIVYGPKPIAEEWPGLTKAGFDSVDVALPSPDGDGKTYFFKGMRYARIKVISGAPDVLEFGPSNIVDHWASFDWV